LPEGYWLRDQDHVTYGLINKVSDHSTYRYDNGEWKSFKYAEPMSRYNRAKHWVDDFNQRRHQPISLEEAFKTKWWPHRMLWARVHKHGMSQPSLSLIFVSNWNWPNKCWCWVLENTIDEVGNVPFSPIRPRKRIRSLVWSNMNLRQRQSSLEHGIIFTRDKGTVKCYDARSLPRRQHTRPAGYDFSSKIYIVWSIPFVSIVPTIPYGTIPYGTIPYPFLRSDHSRGKEIVKLTPALCFQIGKVL
jgi:hypothetical protein